MQLQITLDTTASLEEAHAAIAAIESAFKLPTSTVRIDMGPFAKEVETLRAEAETSDAAALAIAELDPANSGAFTASELAADAVPAPPMFDRNVSGAATLNPAAIGFGLPVVAGGGMMPLVPAVVTEADLTGATSVPPPPTVPLDSSGLPHDPRIHAATRTTMKDGTWKKKPRVTDEEVAAVTAELRGVMGIPAPAAPAYAVGPNTTEVLGHQVTTNFAPVVPAPPVPTAPGVPATFPDFIAWVSPLVTSGKLTVLDVNAAALGLGLVNGSGVGSIQLLANRPDLVPAAHAALSAKVAQ